MSGGALTAKHYLVKLGFCFSSSVVQATVWEACDLTIPHRLRDTHRAMPEESTTSDLVERVRIIFEAADRSDFDAILGFYAPDAIWVGRLFDTKGGVAIRDLWAEYYGTFDEFRVSLEEVRDFGNGVVLAANRHWGRVIGSAVPIDQRAAFVYEFVDGLVVRVTECNDLDEARAAAERLAQERGLNVRGVHDPRPGGACAPSH